MHPVFRCLAYEVLLPTTSGTVTLNRVPSRPNYVVDLRQVHNEGIVIIFEEGLSFQSSGKYGLEMP